MKKTIAAMRKERRLQNTKTVTWKLLAVHGWTKCVTR